MDPDEVNSCILEWKPQPAALDEDDSDWDVNDDTTIQLVSQNEKISTPPQRTSKILLWNSANFKRLTKSLDRFGNNDDSGVGREWSQIYTPGWFRFSL